MILYAGDGLWAKKAVPIEFPLVLDAAIQYNRHVNYYYWRVKERVAKILAYLSTSCSVLL